MIRRFTRPAAASAGRGASYEWRASGSNLDPALVADVAPVARINAVGSILEVVCRTTGRGFAAVARVTEERWVACAVRDEIAFGLAPGEELDLKTTICDEIRASGQPVIIDHVAEDQCFGSHPTPAMYGFQSYISMPIFRPNGAAFREVALTVRARCASVNDILHIHPENGGRSLGVPT